jgi:serine/threonine protein kinase
LKLAWSDPTCDGIWINSAAREHSFVISRERIAKLIADLNAGTSLVPETAAADLPTATIAPPRHVDALNKAPLSPQSGNTLFGQGDLIMGVFRVENVLAGGMGVVYVCLTTPLRSLPDALKKTFYSGSDAIEIREENRYRALKSVRRELLLHGDVRSRFYREALLWISLWPGHPNIVRAWLYEQSTPLLVLEYVEGGDLGRRLGRPLDPIEVARVALQFCAGMIFLFETEGIIHRHRDIKPANILLTRDGTVKITDFGLAKALSMSAEHAVTVPESAAGTLNADFATQFGRIMGSLPWMSPEQFTDPDAVSVASDVYSFGVVLYQMLTGMMPYTASSCGEWMRKVLHETPASPACTAGVDEEASAIVMRCLEKRTDLRYRDFEQLRQALECWATKKGWHSVIPAPVAASELKSKMTADDWSRRGDALGSLGRNEDSYQSCLRALELDPTSLFAHSRLGAALLRLGRTEEAMQYLLKEIELHPTLVEPWVFLGSAYFTCGRHHEEVAAYRRASELAPDSYEVARNYALAAIRAGADQDRQRALAALKDLLDQPGYDTPQTGIKEILLFVHSGDLQTGLELHARSINKYPEVPAAWHNFGVTMHSIGRLDDAINFYSRAINLDKKSVLALAYRGAIRARRGEEASAREDWKAAVASDPDHPMSKSVQLLLQHPFTPPEVFNKSLDALDGPTRLQYLL